MAYKTSYELHHHFPRLAEESGFTFNTHRPRVHIDWNKIKLIDLDSLIRERKFVLIEQHLNDILDCVFESEFDVRILDEGVMKMFRLAQLAVEYQQFCRHYLDRSVYVLREEITSLAQELDTTKKHLQDREEELRKLRKRSRHSYKTPLPYGNDNIAAMILKSLSNKGENIFPSTSNTDALQHNKCSYCDKVFLNQLYLQSHIARRHSEVLDTPQKEKQVNEHTNENEQISAEIMELRTKLKEMERAIADAKSMNNTASIKEVVDGKNSTLDGNKDKKNIMKDAEVSTNTEDYLFNKFEQWKNEEHTKYNKEINELRVQILETINSIKEKEVPQIELKENKIVEQLHSTIKEQGVEIKNLKQELVNSKNEKNIEDAEKKNETEAQILFWTKRAEAQSKQYEALLQKLNDFARDAKESRALAEAERERATQLQGLLQQNLNRKPSETVTTSTDDFLMTNHVSHNRVNNVKTYSEDKKINNKTKQIGDRHTLENLHKKAQELLDIGSLSSTSSESSSVPMEQIKPVSKKDKKFVETPIRVSNFKPFNKLETPKIKDNTQNISGKSNSDKIAKNKTLKAKNNKRSNLINLNETTQVASGSPMRVVRAKLTEEVNSRLASFGVDPLKSRLSQNVFHKQRAELQHLHENKIKKNPSYQKVRHSILAFLDSNTSISNKELSGVHEYVSPTKINKSFRNLTSMISNVKSKALSLVKINDNNKEKRKSLNVDIAKRAMTLLSTPPGSASDSPVNVRSPDMKLSEAISGNAQNANKLKSKRNNNMRTERETKKNSSNKVTVKDLKTNVLNFDTEEESNESDHKYYNTIVASNNSKSIENLIKSPARRPASADTHLSNPVRKYAVENGHLFARTQSATNLSEIKAEISNSANKQQMKYSKKENSSDDVESLSDTPIRKVHSDENIQTVKQTKSVLKNASSISSLNKKKVLFDMDAIQMKSVSASPSQSITEKSDGNEKYELGLVNLDGEEWDISSIENEPLKNDTKIQINTRTSPKIAELKQTIESQLARRSDTPSTAIVGGVDILAGPMIARAPSIGGSNTSLGSSILDDSDGIPAINHKAFVKPKKVTEKDDSELDISEFSIDGIAKHESF